MVIAAMKLKDAYSLEESYDQPRQHNKKQRHYQQRSVLSRLWFSPWSCMDVRVGLEKKPEGQIIDAFELWCRRRLLRDTWTARRSNHSILKINPGCSLEGLMLKLKLQYFDHLM